MKRLIGLALIPVLSATTVSHATETPEAPEDSEAAFDQQTVAQPTVTVDGFSPDRLEAFIRHAYGKLEKFAAGPSSDLTFTLSAFETINSDRFDDIAYRDLATLPFGDVIYIERRRRTESYDGSEVSWVRYIPSWVAYRSPSGDFAAHEREAMLTSSVAEILDLAAFANDDAELRGAIAFTRFRVRVSLGGRGRDYTAAALWIPMAGEETIAMRINDHITQGVAEAAVEQLKSFSEIEDQRQSLRDRLSGAESLDPESPSQAPSLQSPHSGSPPSPASGTCVDSQEFVSGPTKSGQGTEDHLTGAHHYEAKFDGVVRCTSTMASCEHSCNVWKSTGACYETGVSSSACHKMASDTGEYLDTDMGGGPVTCRIGYGCAARPCLLCQCNLSVTVNAGAVGVTIGTSGGEIWKRLAEWTLSDSEGCQVESPSPLPPPPECPPNCSPIVIDLLGNGFSFTNAEEGVDFDFNGDSVADARVGWTASRDDVFLALDRDLDGEVSDGTELFGNFTPQPETAEPNGYNALAVYDVNGDGRIDTADSVYRELLLWRDLNHNGRSEGEELWSLGDLGIDAIYLDYFRSDERDEHGNELRYFGRVCLVRDSEDRPVLSESVARDEGGRAAVLDPFGLRQGQTVTAADCLERVTQSTDVFFVSAEISE